METKHTPGEWEIKSETARQNARVIHKEQGFCIATINPIDEAEANAKLISAAPELLEALQLILITCDIKNINEEYGQLDTHWTNKVLNAIKKATT